MCINENNSSEFTNLLSLVFNCLYDSRLSNGPIESINRKVKDLRRSGRVFRNFEHFRNRFLYATRKTPVLNGVSDYNPVTYFEDDDF
ncbi:MAG: transposase [Alphaproteobacteria bacterium]|uniref:transposase n=1 Tax=Pseudobutyrivibrio sp. TaxID=2014367 RepID=UPI003B1ACC80|nr:transposase [Pseudobutyrivibrio sp.]MBR1734824.1 transposase [Alphaproteobacteria bacterium]